MESKLWLEWRFWFFEILKLSSASYSLKMMSSWKILSFSILLVLFKLVSHTHVHIGIVCHHWTQSLTWSPRNSQDCILSLTSPFLLPTLVSFQSDSRYQVFWLVALVRVSVAVGFPLFSIRIWKKDSQGPSHISLPSGWWLVLPSWVPPSEEA